MIHRLAGLIAARRRVAGFLAVGLSGVGVNTAVLAALAGPLRLPYLVAAGVATNVAIGWNFWWLDRTVFRGPAAGRLGRLGRFWLLNVTLLPVQLGLLALLVSELGVRAEIANVVVLAAVFALRYGASAAWVYRQTHDLRVPGERSPQPVPALAPAPLPVDGLAPAPRPLPLVDPVAAPEPVPVGGPASAPEPLAAAGPAAAPPSRLVLWTGRAVLLMLAVAVALWRPGGWLPFVALLLTVGPARAAGWRGRQLRIVALAVAVYLACVDYLSWRVSVLSWSGWWVGVPLFLAELHAALHSVGLHATLWPQRVDPLRTDRDPAALPLLVLIPTVDEGTEVLRPTVEAAQVARERYLWEHPHAQVTIAVCNDGGVARAACSDEVVELAAGLGVRCVTRTVGGGAKAGNIENARQVLGGTGDALLVIFDADQVADPDFLLRTVSPFADSRIGWVQTGQYYRNRDNPVARWADDQQSLFYGLLCPGKADHDSAFICGTNVVLRAAALDEIGGLPTESVTEDFAASIMLAPRWRSVYLPEVLATGLGPVDLGSYLKQQERWARGTLTVLRRHWPDLLLPRRGGLRAPQRLQYGLAVTHYLCGVRDLVFLVAPVLYLTTGASGVRGATLATFLAHFAPYYLLTIVGFWHAAWPYTSWRAIVIGFGSFPALLRAAWMTLAGQAGRFTITPKTRTGSSSWRTARPHLVALAGCATALGLALTVRRAPAHWLAAAWLAYLCVLIGVHLSLVVADSRAGRVPAGVVRRWPNGLDRRSSSAVPRDPIRLPRPRRLVVGAGAAAALIPVVFVLTPGHAGAPPSPPPAGLPPHRLVGLTGVDAADRPSAYARLRVPGTIDGWTQELTDDFDAGRAAEIRQAGGVPWLTLVLSTNGRSTLDSSLTAIGNGVDDSALTRWATEIAGYGKPVYLTMLPAVDRNYAATSAVAGGGIPQDAPRAWTHLRSVFRAAGATNAAWIWSPADPARDRPYAPAPALIDAVAVTMYEYPHRAWVDPAGTLAAAAARHPGQPLVVDISLDGPSARRTAWLTALSSAVRARPEVAAVSYHPAGPYPDTHLVAARGWRLDDDPAATATLTRLMRAVGAAP